MRRLAALLALALLGPACSAGDDTATPTAPPSVSPTPVTGTLVFATASEVYTLPPGGSPRVVATTPDGITDLEVSADGRYVAFLVDAPRLTLTVHDLAAGRTKTWPAPTDALQATRLGRRGGDFVAVSAGTDNSLLAFSPTKVLDGEGPATTALKGVTSARLVATGGERVLVATGEEASAYRGPETVHEVAPDGTTKRLFTDGDTLPEGEVRNLPIGAAALTADGGRLVYATGTRAGECELAFTVAVRDLRSGREIATKASADSLAGLARVETVTTGYDGRTVAGWTTDVGGCPQPEKAAAFALEGTTWKQVANGARWAAVGPGGRLATLTYAGVLFVSGRQVRGGVALAVWSPV